MSTSWIVGLDGSTGASAALGWAIDAATRGDDSVVPVAAWHLPLPISALAGRRPIDVDRAGLQAEVEFLAGQSLAPFGGDAVLADLRVVEGHPTDALRAVAVECTATSNAGEPDRSCAVVVGRRGIGALQHRLLGSVSQYLATHSEVPLVVVPEGWERPALERIVVGFDGSDSAAAALEWAIGFAPDGIAVDALIAVEGIPWLRRELLVNPDEQARDRARERVVSAARAVDPDGRATMQFVDDDPRHAFTDALTGAELVVVGPRGSGGLARALLGSVTTWLLHESPCPVAVIPS